MTGEGEGYTSSIEKEMVIKSLECCRLCDFCTLDLIYFCSRISNINDY